MTAGRRGPKSSARRSLMRVLWWCVPLSGLFAQAAWPAEWDVVPALSVQGTYTDNLFLAPTPLERSEWVTQVIPAISLSGAGTGMAFSLDYAPELTFYARGQQEDTIFQRGNAVGVAEVAEDLFFVDAGANVDQYNVSLLGPITDNNVNVTGNRATVRTFYVSPYLEHNFGTKMKADARFTYSVLDSNDDPTFNNVADRIDLDLASGPAYRVTSWKIEYSKAAIKYDFRPDIDADVLLANARQLITSTFGLLAQVGDENYERIALGQVQGGSRWGVGFDWAPSSRTRFATIVGKRFFGNAYDVDLVHRTRNMALSVGYTQDVTTSRTEFFAADTGSTVGYLGPLYCSGNVDTKGCQKEVQSIVSERGLSADLNSPVNFFSDQPFLLKRWQASVAMTGVRNIVIANLFTESREVLPGTLVLGTDFALSNTIDQTGTSLLWNLRFSARSALNLDANYSRNVYVDSDRVDDFTSFRMGISRQFQPRLSGSLSYRMQQNESTERLSGYTENSVLATLNMAF